MLKLGKLTDYATLVMTELAATPQATSSAHELSDRSHVAAPTVAKLLRQLGQAGLVESARGVHGGYRLTRDAAAITVADIVVAVEGPVALTECAGSHSCCAIEHQCGVRGNWQLINSAIQHALESVTLAQMAASASKSRHAASNQQPVVMQPRSSARNAMTTEHEISR